MHRRPLSSARRAAVLAGLVVLCSTTAWAQAPVGYRLTFPEPEHRWMQVEVTFPDLPAGTLELRMSRTSPGRYALHEFAKNVFDVRITDGAGKALTAGRPNLHQWDVAGHDGTVRVSYKVFGDRVDGTYLGIDSTHAHINMPAALLWARGLEERAATVRFEPPAGARWQVATQLFPGGDDLTYTAPNLQYLMDSPSEFSAFTMQTFTVKAGAQSPTFRIALHHDGTAAEAERYARDTEAIVREMRTVFGEYPAFERDTYTFIADYLPWANGDGMEHRNSTILTSRSSLGDARLGLLGTVAHEFFHAWNVERIRPRSLEPFDFEDANMSGELWLAEGFTSYYGPLVMHRAGVSDLDDFARTVGSFVNTVTLSPGRRVRTPVEMSQFAPFVDAAAAIDPTNFSNTFISYYTWGAAIGLGLDLALRDRTDGRVTLDDFMRALWRDFGQSGEGDPGTVTRPYTLEDLQQVLASVSGDAGFAKAFFERCINGHEVADYRTLLARAGLALRPRNPGEAWAGDLALQSGERAVVVASYAPVGSPWYAAGVDRDDRLESIDGQPVTSADDVRRAIARRKPGDAVEVVFVRRGARVSGSLRLVEDPRQDVVPLERGGGTLSEAQRRFRESWLGSRQR